MAVSAVEIERVQRLTVVEKPYTTGDKTLVRIVPDKKNGGHLVSELIAERRHGLSLEGHQDRIAGITRRLSRYEGELPDPFNNSKRLSVTKLIATIDQGVYNY